MTRAIRQKQVGAVGFEERPTAGFWIYRYEMALIREVPSPAGDRFFRRTLQNVCNGAWIDGVSEASHCGERDR